MKTSDELQEMDLQELKDYAHEKDVKIKGNVSKETLIERILDHQEESAPSDLPPQTSAVVPEELSLPGGTVVTRASITKRAQVDSGLTVEQWNDLEDKERDTRLKSFVETLTPKKRDEPEPGKVNMASKEHLEDILAPYIKDGLELLVKDNWYEIKYRSRPPISGNLSVPDHLIQAQARALINQE